MTENERPDARTYAEYLLANLLSKILFSFLFARILRSILIEDYKQIILACFYVVFNKRSSFV